MSRGLGKVERAVIDVLSEFEGGTPSVRWLAGCVAEKLGRIDVENRRWRSRRDYESVYRSTLRAVRKLADLDIVYVTSFAEMRAMPGGSAIPGSRVMGNDVTLNVPRSEIEEHLRERRTDGGDDT